jgi:hypothetical protein
MLAYPIARLLQQALSRPIGSTGAAGEKTKTGRLLHRNNGIA